MGHIKKPDDYDDDKIVEEEKALKTGYKKQFKGKCRICGKIGHKGADCWTLEANKQKQPTSYHGERTLRQKIIALQVIAPTATKKDIEKQNAVLSSVTMQTT